MIATRS